MLDRQLMLLDAPQTPATIARKREIRLREWKVVSLREVPARDEMLLADTPALAVEYWHQTVVHHPFHNPEVECLAALMLNTRRRVIGHSFISTGTLDTILVHPREVFRCAIAAAAAAIIVMHNHPSGDPSPSEADIKVTRDLFRAGQLLKLELLDHIVVGRPSSIDPLGYRSLRELGYFYT